MNYATIIKTYGQWQLQICSTEGTTSITLRRDNAWLLLKALVEMLHD